MKQIMIVVIILGVVVSVAATLAWAKSQAASASIISNIAQLRDTNNLQKAQQVEAIVNQALKKVGESLKPIIWLGCSTTFVGVAGLVWTCRKKRIQIVQPAA